MKSARAAFVFAASLGVLFSGSSGGAEPAEQVSSDAPEILHMPELERRADQGILRPVPILTELPRDIAVRARRVLVHYRLWGDPDWTTLELRRNGARYQGAIPCLEISTVTGDLKYYIRVHDGVGRVIATGASRAKPYRVSIRHDSTLDPGAETRAKCPDPADCPRGLPGCPSERVIAIACQTDRDCEGGTTCSWRGFCERVDRKKNWFSLSVEQDLGLVQTAGGCSVASQENEGYACYREDGSQYTGTPVLTNEPIGGGLGPTRVVLGFERLVHYDTSLGARVGWAVLGEGPTPREGTKFIPFSIAARVTHWFGDDVFARSVLRPYVFLTAGFAMVDVRATTRVREDPTVVAYQGGNDLEQAVDIWKRAGDAFAGGGGGLSIPWSGSRAAFVEVGALGAFPFGALVIAPTAGVMLGF
ncbi:MAG TPA: hypothetical protein VE093_46520 [Polyangiaceae bacterium]|jgi:hypothetical protein|nr:hypothetical protein [Polyangiaceae bacterium]